VVECLAERIARTPRVIALEFESVDNSYPVRETVRLRLEDVEKAGATAWPLIVHNDRLALPTETERCGAVAIEPTSPRLRVRDWQSAPRRQAADPSSVQKVTPP
jgi:hypothetical protein